MLKARLVSRLVFAGILAIGMGSAVGAQSARSDEKTPDAKPVVVARTFAALKGVKAEPMASVELKAVKGLHIHFTTPSQNAGPTPVGGDDTGWHLVNFQQNNLGNGQAPAGSGPGYSGLCGAALTSPAITIPGQNPVTGVGGGC